MIVVLLVYNALTAFTSYDLVYAMTGGGPGTATTLLSLPDLDARASRCTISAPARRSPSSSCSSRAVLIVAITKALPSDLFASE